MTKGQFNQVICIGYDPREHHAYEVAELSTRHFAPPNTLILPVELDQLRRAGLYYRPTSVRDGRLWDDISGAYMSTEFAISRFLSIIVAQQTIALVKDETLRSIKNVKWVMFMDCDVMVRKPLEPLFDLANSPELSSKAVICVQHYHNPPEGVKMDGQQQSRYSRKNWSSVMLLNPSHPQNVERLTPELVNVVPGRDLHNFCWIDDDQIGAIPADYNWLVGHSSPDIDPTIVHFTEGIPTMEGYENVAYADEWRDWLYKVGDQ